MGLVIAYKKADRVLFASDTQRTFGDFRYHSTIKGANTNINHITKGITVAFSGDSRIKEALIFMDRCFESFGRKDPLTKEFIMRNVIPQLYDELEWRELFEDDSLKNGNSEMCGTFLLAKGTDIFHIDSDFAVTTVDKYAIIGENSFFALEYIDSAEEKDIEEAMLSVLRYTHQKSITVSAPYYFTDTRSRKFRFAEGTK